MKEEGRQKLSHTGHALRHSFRTLAAAAGIDRFRLKILMNHAIDDDVTDAYANVPALFASLLQAQEQISHFVMTSIKSASTTAAEVRRWELSDTGRLGRGSICNASMRSTSRSRATFTDRERHALTRDRNQYVVRLLGY